MALVKLHDLDVMLPDPNGWEIIEPIRVHPRTGHIPIIMLTARVADAEKVLGLELARMIKTSVILNGAQPDSCHSERSGVKNVIGPKNWTTC